MHPPPRKQKLLSFRLTMRMGVLLRRTRRLPDPSQIYPPYRGTRVSRRISGGAPLGLPETDRFSGSASTAPGSVAHLRATEKLSANQFPSRHLCSSRSPHAVPPPWPQARLSFVDALCSFEPGRYLEKVVEIEDHDRLAPCRPAGQRDRVIVCASTVEHARHAYSAAFAIHRDRRNISLLIDPIDRTAIDFLLLRHVSPEVRAVIPHLINRASTSGA
jgi:hypothetical protein